MTRRGRIPPERSTHDKQTSCWYCGRQYDTSGQATSCEQHHENHQDQPDEEEQ